MLSKFASKVRSKCTKRYDVKNIFCYWYEVITDMVGVFSPRQIKRTYNPDIHLLSSDPQRDFPNTLILWTIKYIRADYWKEHQIWGKKKNTWQKQTKKVPHSSEVHKALCKLGVNTSSFTIWVCCDVSEQTKRK